MALSGRARSISFVTFGMFIVDEIEWQIPNPPAPKTNLIGGAGTYAVLGARLAASPSQALSQTISWIVDVGSDFPAQVEQVINSWKTNCIFRHDSNRLTTRAWNGYGANEFRAFKYLTPKVRLEVSSLNPAQIMSKSFHMVCSPERCLDITTKLREARRAISPVDEGPVIVWEPIPDLCSPAQLLLLQQAAKSCTVVSPNHEELKMFFPPEVANMETQEQLAHRLMGWNMAESSSSQPHSNLSLPFSPPIIVVREGSNGSTAYFRSPSQTITSLHLPAYHTPEMSRAVVDPTGGGNTYLGALAIALALTPISSSTPLPDSQMLSAFPQCADTTTPSQAPDPTDPATTPITIATAMIPALIAASFAIEQHGTPTLTQTPTPGHHDTINEVNGTEHGEPLPDTDADADAGADQHHETWNGQTMRDRTRAYLERERDAILAAVHRRRGGRNLG